MLTFAPSRSTAKGTSISETKFYRKPNAQCKQLNEKEIEGMRKVCKVRADYSPLVDAETLIFSSAARS